MVKMELTVFLFQDSKEMLDLKEIREVVVLKDHQVKIFY
jgi:hypothetical protein